MVDVETDDFVSFPTLCDPETDRGPTLTNLFTKTLRRVTNNASHIVQAYSSPKSPRSQERFPIDSINATPITSAVVRESSVLGELLESQLPSKQADFDGVQDPIGPPVNLSNNVSKDHLPMVTSDSKTLRFSTNSAPVLEPPVLSGNAINSVINVTASAKDPTTIRSVVKDPEFDGGSSNGNGNGNGESKRHESSQVSIFNNLPNDIELSDDSASDTETIHSRKSSPTLKLKVSKPDVSMYSESIVKSSPIRAQQLRHKVSPSVNSYISLRQYNDRMTRKPSSNLSLMDNAKFMIPSLPGSLSSTPSINDNTKRSKAKVRKTSENPLKSGGIHRQYWMNDAFVSECINCFKPFSAFRRKHHCRFCGQIFCNDCTLFVSYTQHKEERRLGITTNHHRKHYNDKLRVCKPCYSDVIVYLSDSDSSSSEESKNDDNEIVSLETEDLKDGIPHPFHRARSHSIQSKNYSLVKQPSLTSETMSPHIENERFDPHPPGLSIPTTRNGEAIEVQTGIYKIQSNDIHLTPNNSFTNGLRMKTNPSLRKSGNNLNLMPQSNSFDNLTSIHGFMAGNKSRIRSQTEPNELRRILSSKFEDLNDNNENHSDNDEDEFEDEFESETEDEQAMSLYTSLNHAGFNASLNSAISPRAPITRPLATLSASSVPTLGEFPTMMVNEKLYPKNSGPRTIVPRFDHILEVNSPFVRFEDNPKSSLRSHERAHASLLRMRSKKGRHKGFRNVLLLSQNNAKLPYLDYDKDTRSVSPPTSPVYEAGSSSSFNFSPDKNTEKFEFDTPSQPSQQISYDSLVSPSKSPTKSPNKSFDKSPNKSFDKLSLEIASHRNLDLVYRLQFSKMLNQCLGDCDIVDNVDKWTTTLTTTISRINDLHITDTLDIKQYIKIKKIPGSTIDKTALIDGVMMTKNIDSKRMANTIDHPKIALLMFPLEYLKQKEQFISLRIVQSQQSVYITNLVSRLVSLEPDIIVVGDTVCQLAEALLEEANITVLSNTKPQVIERLSRYTKGDIFQSVNDVFFKKGSLGTCQKFQVKKYLYNNVLKTFSCFTGTDVQLGFTIVLRGGDEEVLNSIKYTTENLMLVQMNRKFEKSYFEDHRLCYQGDEVHDLVQALVDTMATIKREINDNNIVVELMPDEKEVLEYVDLFLSRSITSSPSSKFSLPAPLENLLQAFIEYYGYTKSHNSIMSSETLDQIHPQLVEDLRLNMDIDKLPNLSYDLLQYLKFVSVNRLKMLSTKFQLRSRNWVNCMKLSCYQLYPIFHKNIHLLYSNISLKYNTPCSGPSIIVVDYYTDNDKCLGLQLDQIFSDSLNVCEECGDLMLYHYRNYVHGNSKIDMIVEKYESLSHHTNQRTVWSVCKECNYTTPVVPMSNDTYYMSIGKYFEVAFWGKNVVLNNCECSHDFFKHHDRYFGFNDMTIKVTHSPIDSYEVVVPRKQIEYDAATEISLKVDSMDSIRTKSNKFFQSVSNRLNRIKVDTYDQEEDGSKRIAELKLKLQEQENHINLKTLEIFNLTLPTDYLSLNSILTQLQELGVLWDKDFNELEDTYLPSENEITRITQFHLRNFLLDRYNEKDVGISNEKEKHDDLDRPKSPDNESPDNESDTVKVNNVSRKVSQMESLLRHETQGHLVHKDSDISTESNTLTKGKVTQLTNYFDQMNFDQISREFRAQRELELTKAKMNHANNKRQAVPIVESKPIVEIYNNIEDVVDVADDERRRIKKAFGPGTIEDIAINDDDKRDTSKEGRKEKKGLLEFPQPERVSLLKSLTNFWADRSASLWEPLEYPLDSTEHTFADSNVIVREDEPSSLVAFCLSTNDYKQKIKVLAADIDNDTKLDTSEVNAKKITSFAKIERKFKNTENSTHKPNETERIMAKNKSNHLKYQFNDGTTELSCKIFYSEQFEALRRSCGKEDKFIQSLSRCVKWNSSGGKSGSNFLKTLDNRFIVKELSKSELESFVSMAPFYFKYISQSMFNTLTTALAKIFGFYQIHIKNSISGKVFRMDFLIMENLFYNIKTTRIFDLKGSVRNRHVTQTGREDEVLLDENMIEYIYESPVFVKENLKKLLRGSLFNDSSFLSAMDIMDYSLVVGINDTSDKLYIGIIDWLRTFTWDKKVENWVKGNNLIGGKNKDPTIVTPKQYRIRFREAMERYILEVPDIWYEGTKT